MILLSLVLALYGRQILALFKVSNPIIESTLGDYVSGLLGTIIGALLAINSADFLADIKASKKEIKQTHTLALILLNDMKQSLLNLTLTVIWEFLDSKKHEYSWVEEIKYELMDAEPAITLSSESRYEKIALLSEYTKEREFNNSDINNLLRFYSNLNKKTYAISMRNSIKQEIESLAQNIDIHYTRFYRGIEETKKELELIHYFDEYENDISFSCTPLHKLEIIKGIAGNLIKEEDKTFSEISKNIINLRYIKGLYYDKFPFQNPTGILDEGNNMRLEIVYRILYELYHTDDANAPCSVFSVTIPDSKVWDDEQSKLLIKDIKRNMENEKEHLSSFAFFDLKFCAEACSKIYLLCQSHGVSIPKEIKNYLKAPIDFNEEAYAEDRLKMLFRSTVYLSSLKDKKKEFASGNELMTAMLQRIIKASEAASSFSMDFYQKPSKEIKNELICLLHSNDNWDIDIITKYPKLQEKAINEIKFLLNNFDNSDVLNGYFLGKFLSIYAEKLEDKTLQLLDIHLNFDKLVTRNPNERITYISHYCIRLDKCPHLATFYKVYQSIIDQIKIIDIDSAKELKTYGIDFSTPTGYSWFEHRSIEIWKIYSKVNGNLMELVPLNNPYIYFYIREKYKEWAFNHIMYSIDTMVRNMANLLYTDIPEIQKLLRGYQDSENNDSTTLEKFPSFDKLQYKLSQLTKDGKI